MDAIQSAIHVEGIPFPVVNKPYLAALKLRSTGYKDAGDVVTLLHLMTAEEKEKTMELAKKTGRNKKLEMLLSNAHEDPGEEVTEELI